MGTLSALMITIFPRRFPLPEARSAGREKAIEHVIKKRDGTIGDPDNYLVGRDETSPKG
jgi:hypothetical protein